MIRGRSLALLIFGLAGLLGLAGTACGESSEDAAAREREQDLRALLDASQVPVHARFDADRGHAISILGRFPSGPADPELAAATFLAQHHALLGLRQDLADLWLSRRVEDIGGVTLSFEQDLDGVLVFDAAVLVGFDPEGAIIHVENDYVHDLDGVEPKPELSPEEAIKYAEAHLDEAVPEEVSPDLVIVRGDKEHEGEYLAWLVSPELENPRRSWHVFVSAVTGEIVRSVDLVKRAGPPCEPCDPSEDFACGNVFLQNPIDSSGDPDLRDSSDVDDYETGCVLHNLKSEENLNGAWVNTGLTSDRVGPPYEYLRSENQAALDELNVYYHANRAKEYLDSLQFPGVMNFSLSIDAHDPTVGDNAHYMPLRKAVEFGVGGVDDAQDPDVIYHEYAHAIQDNQVPGYGATEEGGATGEGFGDYWAAAMTDEMPSARMGEACVAAWDATAYSPWDGEPGSGCLRRLDAHKQYPRDFEWEVHRDGEMWSTALWTLRQDPRVGAAAADPLVIKSHTFLTPNALFVNSADALISADVALYGGEHADVIHEVMGWSGIPRTGLAVSDKGVDRFAAYTCASGHEYENLEYAECKFRQPGARRVRFRFARLETEKGYDFISIGDPSAAEVERISGSPDNNCEDGERFCSRSVSGDTIVLRFKADDSVTDFGFEIDGAYYSTSP